MMLKDYLIHSSSIQAHKMRKLTFKRSLKFCLPILSVGIVLCMVLQASGVFKKSASKENSYLENILQKEQKLQNGSSHFQNLKSQKNSSFYNFVSNLKYKGQTSNNSIFQISSKQGREVSKGLIVFEEIQSKVETPQGDKVLLNAYEGLLNREDKTISLKGNVKISKDEEELVLETESVEYDVGKGTAVGNSPLLGRHKKNKLSCRKFRLEKEGQKIVLLGDPQIILNAS